MSNRQHREKRFKSPRELFQAALAHMFPREKMQAPKRQTMFCYTQGPMYYLGQQIVKAMQDAGYPAKIHCCYRSPAKQMEAYYGGFSKAKAGQSPHQYMEAVDIIHPSKGWAVSKAYWDTLEACVEIVAEKHNVQFTGGFHWGWDFAHIELRDWRTVKDDPDWLAFVVEERKAAESGQPAPPVPEDALWRRFVEVLPEVAKRRGQH